METQSARTVASAPLVPRNGSILARERAKDRVIITHRLPGGSLSKPPHVLIFDSGLGGLTVLAEVMRLRPDVSCLFAADDAGFPYGRLAEPALIARVGTVVAHLVSDYAPDAVIIACNTAATAVLPHLRASYPQIPFIGTVPAVKPAAAQSRSKLISVLATPGTVARDYTHDLVRTYAAHCDVTLVGSTQLAGLAEACMKGEDVADAAIVAEIAPSFVEKGGQRTPIVSCSPAPIIRCCSSNSSGLRPGPSPGSTRLRPSHAGSTMCCRRSSASPRPTQRIGRKTQQCSPAVPCQVRRLPKRFMSGESRDTRKPRSRWR